MHTANSLYKLSWYEGLGIVMVAVCVLMVSAPVFSQVKAEQDSLIHGQGLARENCARCHAIGLTGESPNQNAPSFRSFSSYRSTELISWMLIDKTTPRHSQMPQFDISAEQALDIVAWINWVQPEAHGERLVQENCSRCHAVTMDDDSRHPSAIPFRNISMFYPVDALEEAFAEGIETGHPDMPVFDASITQVRDMIAYIKTLE